MRSVTAHGLGLFGALSALLLTFACLGAAHAQQAADPPSQPLQLQQHLRIMQIEGQARAWVDAQADATIEQVSSPAGLARFRPVQRQIHSLAPTAALWLHYRLARAADERHDWLIEFPMPTLDEVTVFQADARGWRAESAGDNLAVAQWPEAGRYPHFRLNVPRGDVRDVFVRIRNTTSADFPVRLITEPSHSQHIQLEYLGLGTTFGALLLMIAACLAQSWVYRDRAYAWYAVYATVTALAVAAYTGVAAHLLWPGFGALQDAPQSVLAFLACAAALLFVRHLIGIPARYRRFDKVVRGLGLAGLLLAALPLMVPKMTMLAVLGAYAAAAYAINIGVACSAWRRGDEVGLWVLAANVPLTLAVGMGLARMFGWLPVSFGTQYAVVVAMAFEVPMLLVALTVRSRERHGAEIREQALSTQDALTGLLAPHLFHDRLQQVVARHRRDRESAAVVFIDLVNYARIKEVYGSSVAEQSLLRSVIKLRRVLRNVDTASRIGEARFGIILEGVTSRTTITDRAARLIASGLMPLPGLKPEVTLQFHVAAVLLDEHHLEAPELAQALDALLGEMSARTRRPIRFIETGAAPDPDSDASQLSPTPPKDPDSDRPQSLGVAQPAA